LQDQTILFATLQIDQPITDFLTYYTVNISVTPVTYFILLRNYMPYPLPNISNITPFDIIYRNQRIISTYVLRLDNDE
jgi:hypothetical protein